MTLPPILNPRELLKVAQPFLGPPPDLTDLRYLMLDRGSEIAEAFYEVVMESPEASKFIADPAKLAKLHASLQEWLKAFFSSTPDRQFRAELAARMTAAHQKMNMPLELFLLGHKCLRRILVRELMERWPAGDRLGLMNANERLNQAFDFDMLLMVTSYHGAAVASAESNAQRLENLNGQLQQSLTAQESLLRTTSHELRTPLAGLVGLLNMMRRGAYSTEEQQREAMSDIQGAANHLLSLTDDLLSLARLDLGRGRFEFKMFEARAAAVEILRRFMPKAEEKGLRLEVEGQDPLQIHADRDRFEQILSNLLQNGLRHTAEGGVSIQLESMPGTGLMKTTVSDTGEGISDELIPHLFHPLTSENNPQGRRSGSLGLGLSICKRLVLAMGGRIWIEVGRENGTAISFTLPETGDGGVEPRHFGEANAPFRVLMVDDDPIWIGEFSTWLAEELELQVTAVATAEQAKTQVLEQNFHLILADIGLPVAANGQMQDGLDLLKELAHFPDAMFVPKWLVSGHDAEVLKADLEGAWHDAYWNKASMQGNREDFLAAIRELFAQPS